ncbi:MAG: carboxypeptidase regulatory-like domain-containing protein, partial [Spirosomataceae bacterium]
MVVDTAGNPLAFSSVLLLIPEDSTLVTYALADDEGAFTFKNVQRQPYLLKATFISYLPYQELITPTAESILTVENIALKPLIRELYEVVIRTAKAPISIKGDTVEYDASKFKVPPGSTVEDLLRKLPGVEVLQDGT